MHEITQQWVDAQKWHPAKPHLLTLTESFGIIDQTKNTTCLIWFRSDGTYAGYSRVTFRRTNPIVGDQIAIVMTDERPPKVHLANPEDQCFVWPNACFNKKGEFPCVISSTTE